MDIFFLIPMNLIIVIAALLLLFFAIRHSKQTIVTLEPGNPANIWFLVCTMGFHIWAMGCFGQKLMNLGLKWARARKG